MKKKSEHPDEETASGRETADGAHGSGSESAPADALAEALRARDEHLARWQRAQADFQNLRRRTQSDIDAAVRRSQQGLLEGILLAIDQLELALAAPRGDAAAESWTRGVEMTKAELLRTLSNAGAQPLAGVDAGARFDPALHQAVASRPAEGREPGLILDVVRTGYTWGQVVLRPAQVIVSAAPPGAAGADLGTLATES
ncbi:MAG: nucleotide exchange factor GrpE [Planctomycetes bacterium]|nr:nucleotide exchange factor GrpE [Planctomycetota bacterium]